MAERKIKWTLRAIKDKLGIYQYWLNKNKSIEYPEKLERLFNEAMKLTAIYPDAGIQTEIKNVRLRIVKEYKLFYRTSDDFIEILSVWDSRRDPEKLKIK